MKNSIGVVAEYNPFHNGHLLHLTEARRLAGENLPVVAVMSGSIVQRGEIAFANKWLRAQLAVMCGADLVLELPVVFSCRSAEFFAAGAVKLLAAAGVVKYLAFGAETAETESLTQAAAYLASHQNNLRSIIQSGVSYAAALSQLLQNTQSAFTPKQSNDILALEYCRSLQKYAPDIKPLVIRRKGAGYNDNNIANSLASAAAIRAEYAANGLTNKILCQLPPKIHSLIKEAGKSKILGCDTDILNALVLYRLQMLTEAQIAAACECSEGLEHRLKKSAAAKSIEEIASYASSKRYAKARIRRLLMQLLLNTDKTAFTDAQPQYLRVLAFNQRGRQVLSQMRTSAKLPVITKLGRNFKNCRTGNDERSLKITQQLELDVKAANILELTRLGHQNNYNSDFLNAPVFVR